MCGKSILGMAQATKISDGGASCLQTPVGETFELYLHRMKRGCSALIYIIYIYVLHRQGYKHLKDVYRHLQVLETV